MKSSPVPCRRSPSGRFTLSFVSWIPVVFVGLMLVIKPFIPEDPRVEKINTLVLDFLRIQSSVVSAMVDGKPQDPKLVAENQKRAEAAYAQLRSAVDATPPELVPYEAWEVVDPDHNRHR